MWIAPQARGLGLGRRLLHTLEGHALTAGARVARIETNSDLKEALDLYASAGWAEVAPFNDEPFADRWLEKGSTTKPPSPNPAGDCWFHKRERSGGQMLPITSAQSSIPMITPGGRRTIGCERSDARGRPRTSWARRGVPNGP